jgi:tetratricopeptide (TPR) repeat protein/tRNA A-37 threonylcarbamoyl transferase component Bud32
VKPSFETLKEIFHSARALPSEKRKDFLDQTCGQEDELRREVEALLKSDEAAGEFIADLPPRLVADAFGGSLIPSDAERMIGQYKLLECIGSGGMGAVYLAERADRQFQMRVAIKLIKRGMDTDSVLRRFQHERQILASLEHPNIARLLDGGTTGDGLPYFVMEYIEGARIDQYAEQKDLSITARLELFRQVCGAVSYAHQNLVVHRDLKPSNVLVTPEGVPKLLDFGIAKIIQAGDGAEALATITAIPAMTPEYASPEQIEGTHATTLSDVYSLGAVLYQLLTGHPPYRLQNRSPQEIAKAITTTQLEKPSAKATRAEDGRRLRGDLDNIVLMAMRRDTARRYRSVEQFSEDIRRHLAGRPVIARADTLSYRAGKFWQRNKLGIAAAALLLFTLVGGIVATSRQALRARVQEQHARAEQARAERRFNDVRNLAHSVLFDYHDAIKALPGATKVRELLVRDALNYLDSLASEAQGDRALQLELAAAYERVGDVRQTLGDMAGTLESQMKALRIREALVAADPSDLQARRGLASSHRKIGDRLGATGNVGSGLEHLKKALSIFLELTREEPADADLQNELAETRLSLASDLSGVSDFAGALEQARAALATWEQLMAANPREPRYRYKIWWSQMSIAYTLWLTDDVANAIAANAKALALGEALLAQDPLNADYRRSLVINYQNGGDMRQKIDKRGALESLRRAVEQGEKLVAADPANATARIDLAYNHKRVADFLAELNEHSEALQHFRQATEDYQRVIKDAPEDLSSRFYAATCRAGLARMRACLGEIEPALEECDNVIAFLRETSGDQPGNLGKAQPYEYLGYAYVALAASPRASADASRKYMTAAREMFRQSQSIIDEARRRDGDLGQNENWARDIAAEIVKCDAALAR